MVKNEPHSDRSCPGTFKFHMYPLFIFYTSINVKRKKCVIIVMLVSCQKSCQSLVTQTREIKTKRKKNESKRREAGFKGEILLKKTPLTNHKSFQMKF